MLLRRRKMLTLCQIASFFDRRNSKIHLPGRPIALKFWISNLYFRNILSMLAGLLDCVSHVNSYMEGQEKETW